MGLPDPTPPVVLTLNVGSSSLKGAIRGPDLRMRVEVAGLDGAAGHLTISGTRSFAESAIVPNGWAGALPAVAEAVARHGLHREAAADDQLLLAVVDEEAVQAHHRLR